MPRVGTLTHFMRAASDSGDFVPTNGGHVLLDGSNRTSLMSIDTISISRIVTVPTINTSVGVNDLSENSFINDLDASCSFIHARMR